MLTIEKTLRTVTLLFGNADRTAAPVSADSGRRADDAFRYIARGGIRPSAVIDDPPRVRGLRLRSLRKSPPCPPACTVREAQTPRRQEILTADSAARKSPVLRPRAGDIGPALGLVILLERASIPRR